MNVYVAMMMIRCEAGDNWILGQAWSNGIMAPPEMKASTIVVTIVTLQLTKWINQCPRRFFALEEWAAGAETMRASMRAFVEPSSDQ